MFDDPAVRSVRVAVALCDRFAELLKGPTQVSARKQHGALFGVSGNDGDLSLRIGEAQQLYPEIWRHLDDARAAFAAREIDVARYDQLRAAEGLALGADVDVKHARHGYGEYAVDETVKSATFNREGLARARQACDALVRATPQIDWAAIARAESQDPAVAAFGRATRVKRWTGFALIFLVIASPFIYVLYTRHQEQARIDERRRAAESPPPLAEAPRLGEQERAELAGMVTQTRAMLAGARKGWEEAVAPAALARAVPGPRPCAHPFEAPPQQAADSFVRDGTVDSKVFGASAFQSHAAGQPVPDDQLAHASSLVDAVDRRLAAGVVGRFDREELARIDPYIAFLIIDREVQPELTGTGPKATYVPGEVIGRAYVYSVREAKIACAGAVAARNAAGEDPASYLEAVRAARDGRAVLHRELEVRIRQAFAAGLRSTAP